jgi:hypothetical protein
MIHTLCNTSQRRVQQSLRLLQLPEMGRREERRLKIGHHYILQRLNARLLKDEQNRTKKTIPSFNDTPKSLARLTIFLMIRDAFVSYHVI